MSCSYYENKGGSGFFGGFEPYCHKKGGYVNSDVYDKYCKNYNYDEFMEQCQILRMNRAEVIAMSIFEYDKEEEEKKLRKAEFEAGVAEGLERGIEYLAVVIFSTNHKVWECNFFH